MPAPATAAAFLDVCRKSGIVDEAALSKIAADTPVAAAKALLRAGALTKFQAGQLLAGKHRGLRFDRLKILDKIGAGGMGTVFLCEHLGLQRQVAVKVLPPEQAGDEGTRERFFREARAAAALDHPNIVRVHDSASSGGIHYIVMEYIQGHDLQTLVNKYGPLPHRRACTYIAQAALGLQHAHEKGLVHRDVKPANLLVDQDGVVKILDMGLARFNDPAKDGLTAKYDNGAILGTADYMAPEQIVASSAVDVRADIYSLGVTLYAVINGKPPFGGSCTQKMMGHTSLTAVSLTSVRREVPKGLSAVVEKMMAKDPDDRYATPADVVDALAPWLEGDTVPLDSQKTRRITGAKSGRKKPVKRKSRLPLVAGVSAAVLVFGGVGVWLATGSTNTPQANASLPPAMAAVGAPTDHSPPKSSPPKVAPKPEPVVASGVEVYRMNLAGRGEQRMWTGAESGGDELPDGFKPFTWEPGTTAEAGIASLDGGSVLTLRTRKGRPTAMLFGPYVALKADHDYVVSIDYRLPGSESAEWKVDDSGVRGRVLRELPTTGTNWSTATTTFRAGQSTQAKFEIGYLGGETLSLRSYRVQDLGVSPRAATELYRLDPAKLGTYRVKKRGTETLEEQGNFPEGFTTFAWDGPTVMSFAVGDGELRLENLEGKPTAMLFLPEVKAEKGARHWLRLEYKCNGFTAGMVRVISPGGKVRDIGDLPGTNGQWQVRHVPYELIGGERDSARLEIHARLEGALHVRSAVVTQEAVGDPVSPTSYRLDLSDAKAFARRYREASVIESQGEGDWPRPWTARTDDAATKGDAFIDTVAGSPAIGLRNEVGPATTRLYTVTPVLPLQKGKRYALKVTYHTETNGHGTVAASVGGKEVGKVALTAASTWTSAETILTTATDGGLTLSIACGSVGSEASVYVKSLEVTPVD